MKAIQALRRWQQHLVALLQSEERPPVVVVNMPRGDGKSWAVEHLPAEIARHYESPGFQAVGVDADALVGGDASDDADLLAAVLGNEFVLIDNVSARTAPAVLQVLRVLDDEVTVVAFGEDCSPLVDELHRLPGLQLALLGSFEGSSCTCTDGLHLAWAIFETWRVS